MEILFLKLSTDLCTCRHIYLPKNSQQTKQLPTLWGKGERYKNMLIIKKRCLGSAFGRSFTEFLTIWCKTFQINFGVLSRLLEN